MGSPPHALKQHLSHTIHQRQDIGPELHGAVSADDDLRLENLNTIERLQPFLPTRQSIGGVQIRRELIRQAVADVQHSIFGHPYADVRVGVSGC